MINVATAVEHLEVLFLDEFKSSFLDKPSAPDRILTVHKYFKYQTRIYTFGLIDRIPQLYNDLRLGQISDAKDEDGSNPSYPLMFLTELSQRLLVMMAQQVDEEGVVTVTTPDGILADLAKELSELMTAHGYEQDYITDDYYQSCIEASEWFNILDCNPWLLVAILIRYTSYELTDNLYAHLAIGRQILAEPKV